jgi:hypothetical protein
MNKDGLIYRMTDEQIEALSKPLPEDEQEAELRDAAARFDGYKRAFREAQDALAGAQRHPDEAVRESADGDDG